MSIEETVIRKLRTLNSDQQKEVLTFVESLSQKDGPRRPLRSLRGLWADFGVDITEEDIAEARHEMWGKFPRDIL
jgi:hypothetical protein